MERKVNTWANQSSPTTSSVLVSIFSAAVAMAARPTRTRCTREATIQRRPTTLWSPEPRTAARPEAAGAGAGAAGSGGADAAVGTSSVTVIEAPGGADGFGFGI